MHKILLTRTSNVLRFGNVALQFSTKIQPSSPLLDVSPEVAEAVASGKPVVALESTIITHGMPWPQNLETATAVETVVREEKAIPATIAIIKGRIKVGLSKDELTSLADNSSTGDKRNTIKTSRRDMAYVLSNGLNGGTTVSGTIIAARLANIKVFGTGGIGGVHREGESTLDISADLTELGRNPVAVVSSGVKSILDIPRTLEYLETQGVCVASFGSSKLFPAFYTRSYNNIEAPYNVGTAEEAAKLIDSSLQLNLGSGILIAVPVPKEFAMDESTVEGAIRSALEDAKRSGISGKQLTPFILSAIANITKGKSLQTNMALVKNNVQTAAKIAVALSELQGGRGHGEAVRTRFTSEDKPRISPVVIGGSIVDSCVRVKDHSIELNGSTHMSSISISGGGVGRNICESLSKLGAAPTLISAIGNDSNGQFLNTLLAPECRSGVFTVASHPSANYTAVIDRHGECKLGLGDMSIHEYITPNKIIQYEDLISDSPLIIVDGNVPTDTIAFILELVEKYNKPVFYEPTDVRKASKPFLGQRRGKLSFSSPNIYELQAMAIAAGCEPGNNEDFEYKELKELDVLLEAVFKLSSHVINFVDVLVITLGKFGVAIVRKNDAAQPFFKVENQTLKYLPQNKEMQFRYYPSDKVTDIENVSGAGDNLAGGFIYAMLQGMEESTCVSVAMTAAKMSMLSKSAVPDFLFSTSHNCWSQRREFKNIINILR